MGIQDQFLDHFGNKHLTGLEKKHGLFTQDFIDLDNKFTKNIVKVLKNGQEFTYLDYYNSYQEARLECLKKTNRNCRTTKEITL